MTDSASKPMQTRPPAGVLAGGVPDERSLMALAVKGDREAYGMLVVRYQDRLYNAVYRLVGNPEDACEVLQEAFLKGLAHLQGFRGDAEPYTWLFRIAYNHAIGVIRKRKRHREVPMETGDDDDHPTSLLPPDDRRPGPQDHLAHREECRRVVDALARLDEEDRAVLVMREIEGFDYQDMAVVLDMPLGTLKSRLFRARLALRNQMMAQGKEIEP